MSLSRTILLLGLLVGGATLAQSSPDEWSTLPPAAPAAQPVSPQPVQPSPAAPSRVQPPQPTRKEVPPAAPARRTDDARTAVTPPPSAAAAPKAEVKTEAAPQAPKATAPARPEAGGETEEGRVVGTRERFLPGSEPHSPSTWGRAIDDPANLRHTTTTFGGLGILHLPSADLGRRGILRFSAEGEYFTRRNFPVAGAANVRSAGTFAVSWVPLDFLETYLSYSASANTNSTSSPPLIQALGDITFGVKVSRKWAEGFYAGVDLRALSFSGVGNQDLSRYALGFWPSLMLTYDLRERWPRVPLRVNGGVGIALDGTEELVRQHSLEAAEEFALGVNRFNRLTAGAALEFPLPVATPFVEYTLAVPLGVEGGMLTAPDEITELPVTRAMPQRVSLGLKVTAVKDVTLMAAVELGLTSGVGLGVPATPPFNLLFGASFAVDPFQRGETRLVETTREQEVKTARREESKTGKASGVVVDAATHKPVPGAIVTALGAKLPPVASDAESGRFLTHELPLPGGPLKLVIRKDGYKELSHEVVLEPGKVTNVELALEALPKKAHFLVTTSTGKKKKPVETTVTFKGAEEQQVQTQATAKEPVKVEAPPGRYEVTVNAPGYLSQVRDVHVSENAEMALAFDLLPTPKKQLVIVKENKLEILQQIHFATAKATILADSHALLAEVVDAIVKNGVKRIRVEGHTDNRGNKKTNLKLSEDRARAVGEFLAKSGIDPARVETAGFGDSRPLAPNMTARGRELNRRVEFIIVDR